MCAIWLKDDDIKVIINIISKFQNVKSATIFWSRSIWNYKNWSDIDIALKWKIDFLSLAKIKYQLEENTLLPYFFNVIDYGKLDNDDLKTHIDEYWIIFYEK